MKLEKIKAGHYVWPTKESALKGKRWHFKKVKGLWAIFRGRKEAISRRFKTLKEAKMYFSLFSD